MRILLSLLMCIYAISVNAQFDILITNGKIIDGTGNHWYYADVAIKDGKIAAIGKLSNQSAAKVIDAKGLYISPGFIDVHAHIEGSEVRVPTADNFIFDGVTSVITGNCGSSRVDLKKYFSQIDSVKTSINIATLIGHNSVRREVIGNTQRDPSAEEQKQMEDLVAQAMREGAVGFSTGLIYVPGTYSKTPEVVGLAKAASAYNGVYASHIRSEGDQVTDAINEAINIGREANMPVQISHFKVTYKPNWGRSVQTLGMIDQARKEGIDVTIDQYPYVASSTTLNTVIPTWVFSGGNDSVLYRLNDPVIRKQIKKEMLDILKGKQLKHYDYAFVARYSKDSTYNGKNIYEINKMLGKKAKAAEEAETIMDMVANGSAQMVYFSMHEDDLQRIMKYPFNMFASDAGIPVYGSGMPHPRAYGTNSRIIGRYVNELNVMRLEEAIRRMTSLPAQKFNLRDRGLIREGYAADILIFDAAQVKDESTFQQPHAYSKGFKYVIVNGELVVENEQHKGTRSGRVLYGPGYLR